MVFYIIQLPQMLEVEFLIAIKRKGRFYYIFLSYGAYEVN